MRRDRNAEGPARPLGDASEPAEALEGEALGGEDGLLGGVDLAVGPLHLPAEDWAGGDDFPAVHHAPLVRPPAPADEEPARVGLPHQVAGERTAERPVAEPGLEHAVEEQRLVRGDVELPLEAARPLRQPLTADQGSAPESGVSPAEALLAERVGEPLGDQALHHRGHGGRALGIADADPEAVSAEMAHPQLVPVPGVGEDAELGVGAS